MKVQYHNLMRIVDICYAIYLNPLKVVATTLVGLKFGLSDVLVPFVGMVLCVQIST